MRERLVAYVIRGLDPRIQDWDGVEAKPRTAVSCGRADRGRDQGLANFAHRGRIVPNTEIRELVTTYPYLIRYRIALDEVRILRVRHTSRRPTSP